MNIFNTTIPSESLIEYIPTKGVAEFMKVPL